MFRRFAVVRQGFTALPALICLLVFVPGAQAISWNLPAEPLTTAGPFTYPPQVAVAPDGATTVVWSRDDGSGYIVQARTRPAGSNTFGAVQDLSGTSSDDLAPQVAVAPDGATTVVWYREIGPRYIVQARTRPAGSETFGDVQDLSNTTSGTSFPPQVAVGADGATTVVWRWNDGGFGSDYIVQARTRPAGSTTFGAAQDLSPAGGDAYAPQVAVAPDGATTVVWRWDDKSPGSDPVQASTRPAGSGTFGAAEGLSPAGGDAYDPQVAVGADGATTVVWRWNDGTNDIVQASTRPAGSGTFGAAEGLSPAGGCPPYTFPQVAVAPDGTTTVAWPRLDGSDCIIQASTRPAGSNTFGAAEDLSDPDPSGGTAYDPQVAVAPDGATTVVSSRIDGSGNPIVQTRTRPAGSGTFGAVQDLSATGGNAGNPQVSVGADGAATVVWLRAVPPDGPVVEYASSTATNYTLTSQLTGDGTGTVSSTPAGINCGSACSASFPLSSRVALTADPAAGSTFAGWGGACSGSSTTCTVTILGDRTATATFAGGSPTLKVSLTAPKRVTGGKSFGVKLKVTNRAGGVATSKSLSPRAGVEARSVKTCLNVPSPLITIKAKGAKINGRTACWTRSTLGSGKSVTYSAKIKAPRSASGSKSLKATVRASDTAGDVVNVTGRAKVKVKKAEPPKPKPPTG